VIKAMLGIDPEEKISLEILSTMNIEEVFLIPSIDHTKDQGPYVLRKAYYVGRSLETNRVYDLLAYTLPMPKTQHATHIIIEARSAETDLESFQMTSERFQKLRETFATDNVYTKFEEIAEEMAAYTTRIYGRTDLHIAVDLVFHSPLGFDFDGVRVKKGWLEGLILGDTRTGKGFVTEGYSRYYGVGEVVSGENLTFAGLIAAVQHVGDRWTLTWGKIPLADKRLIIMDECASLSHETIGNLSRIRSEGVVEVTKVITEKTTARTRLIWLANPRPRTSNGLPKVIADYNHGVEAVPELIGAAEDVARFDFVLIVGQAEVSAEVINAHNPSPTAPRKYSGEICRELILWTWSRKPEQVHFTSEAIEFTLKAAKVLGRSFSPKVCLIQAEDVRHKIARIAASAAARTFSTEDGENIIVRGDHVQFAYNFLQHIYSKPCCGYLQMSLMEQEQSELREPERIRQCLMEAVANDTEGLKELVSGLLQHRNVTLSDLQDYAGLERHPAKFLVSELVRCRAVTKEQYGYVKKPAFKAYLQALKAEITEEPYETQAEEGVES
jgi:hypothetical protein